MCTAFVTAMIAVQKHHKTENAARSFFWEAGDGVSQHTPTHSLIATHSIPHPPPTHTLLHPLTRTLPTHTLPHPLTQSLYPPPTHTLPHPLTRTLPTHTLPHPFTRTLPTGLCFPCHQHRDGVAPGFVFCFLLSDLPRGLHSDKAGLQCETQVWPPHWRHPSAIHHKHGWREYTP